MLPMELAVKAVKQWTGQELAVEADSTTSSFSVAPSLLASSVAHPDANEQSTLLQKPTLTVQHSSKWQRNLHLASTPEDSESGDIFQLEPADTEVQRPKVKGSGAHRALRLLTSFSTLAPVGNSMHRALSRANTRVQDRGSSLPSVRATVDDPVTPHSPRASLSQISPTASLPASLPEAHSLPEQLSLPHAAATDIVPMASQATAAASPQPEHGHDPLQLQGDAALAGVPARQARWSSFRGSMRDRAPEAHGPTRWEASTPSPFHGQLHHSWRPSKPTLDEGRKGSASEANTLPAGPHAAEFVGDEVNRPPHACCNMNIKIK